MSSTPRPFEEPPPTGDPRLDAVARLLAIVDRLRAPDGCPWDLEQTVASLAPSLIEESHEMVEAVEQGDDAGTVEEAGDVLMVVALIAKIADQDGRFDFGDAARAVGDKLLRRHPHVFGEAEVTGSEHVIANWERIKRAERSAKEVDDSALAGVPVALPALQRAQRLGAKAVAAGFQWTDRDGALAKLEEEVAELREALASGDREAAAAELGDVLLAAALVGEYAGLDAEVATRAAARRFEARFRHVEAALGARLGTASLPELLAAWEAAKRAEAEDESGRAAD
jgi:MazG family protein